MSHIYKVLPVLHFMLIIKSDLPLASGLIIVNNKLIITITITVNNSCSCHALLQDTALLSSVIPLMFAIFVPWMPEDVISDG